MFRGAVNTHIYIHMGYSRLVSSDHGILQGRILEWVCHSLLQGIFLTQGLKLGLLHCRQILYCVYLEWSLFMIIIISS